MVHVADQLVEEGSNGPTAFSAGQWQVGVPKSSKKWIPCWFPFLCQEKGGPFREAFEWRPSPTKSTSRTKAAWLEPFAFFPHLAVGSWTKEIKPCAWLSFTCLFAAGLRQRYHVRNYLWIFVNAQIENPSFDSQTKETMTLKAAKFGLSWLFCQLLGYGT